MARKEVRSEITGSVWKIMKNVGERVVEDDVLMILESMKMEIPLLAETKGWISEILVYEGQPIAEGQVVMAVET